MENMLIVLLLVMTLTQLTSASFCCKFRFCPDHICVDTKPGLCECRMTEERKAHIIEHNDEYRHHAAEGHHLFPLRNRENVPNPQSAQLITAGIQQLVTALPELTTAGAPTSIPVVEQTIASQAAHLSTAEVQQITTQAPQLTTAEVQQVATQAPPLTTAEVQQVATQAPQLPTANEQKETTQAPIVPAAAV